MTNNRQQGSSLPEVVTFWASLLIVVALFGFLVFHAVHVKPVGNRDTDPNVSVTVQLAKARKMDDTHWIVPVVVHNVGKLALEEVNVHVTSRGKNNKERVLDLSFAYLAEGASEEAMIVTDVTPETAAPQAEVLAFKTQRKARGY